MHTAVVELHPLADAVRTAAEDHDRRPFERGDLTDILVGAVVIRRGGRELGGARVDRLVRDVHPRGVADRAHQLGRFVPEVGELTVAEAEAFRPPPGGAIQIGGPDEPFEFHRRLDDLLHLIEEPRVDTGDVVQAFDGDPAPEGHRNREEAVGRGGATRSLEVVDAQIDERRVAMVESGAATLQRPQRLLQ